METKLGANVDHALCLTKMNGITNTAYFYSELCGFLIAKYVKEQRNLNIMNGRSRRNEGKRKREEEKGEKEEKENENEKEQGRIHSRTVADGLAGAVMQKPLAI